MSATEIRQRPPAADDAILALIATADVVADELERLLEGLAEDHEDVRRLAAFAEILWLATLGAMMAVHGDIPESEEPEIYWAYPGFVDVKERTDGILLEISREIRQNEQFYKGAAGT